MTLTVISQRLPDTTHYRAVLKKAELKYLYGTVRHKKVRDLNHCRHCPVRGSERRNFKTPWWKEHFHLTYKCFMDNKVFQFEFEFEFENAYRKSETCRHTLSVGALGLEPLGRSSGQPLAGTPSPLPPLRMSLQGLALLIVQAWYISANSRNSAKSSKSYNKTNKIKSY